MAGICQVHFDSGRRTPALLDSELTEFSQREVPGSVPCGPSESKPEVDIEILWLSQKQPSFVLKSQ
jgi:hypothetical protein